MTNEEKKSPGFQHPVLVPLKAVMIKPIPWRKKLFTEPANSKDGGITCEVITQGQLNKQFYKYDTFLCIPHENM
jgi:hypothetical protein